MTRTVVKWGLAAVLGGMAVAGRAPAQFISVANPVTGGRFNYTRFNTFSLTTPTPYGGSFTYNRTYIGQLNGIASAGNPYQGSYMSGGFGSGGYVDPQAAQRQNDLAKAQKQGRGWAGNGAARTAIADQWAYEKGAKAAAVNAAAVPAAGSKPKGVNPHLLDAGPAEIASGTALNELLAAVRPLDDKVTKAVDSALLPPDLAARIAFAGGPSADAVNLLRVGSLDFPAGLRDPQFNALRADLAREYTVLGEAASQNRATAAGAADRVIAAVRKARDTTAPAVREMAYQDSLDVARFFNRLDAAARLLKDPTAAPAYVPNWSTLGLTVKELVRHMARYKLTFGPAAPSDESAYEVLHRGLVEYYLTLTQAAK